MVHLTGKETMRPLTFGSLFAGIGGMDLGLERAGMACRWQVEIDPFCCKVLEKHWPGVRRWDDVRTFPPEGDWAVDLIAGGFPCQDISNAGKRVGIDGERSGLWSEFARIIGILRPRYVLVENVAALLERGIRRVLGDLALLGFDAEWDCLPASAFGAPHFRSRVFIVAAKSSTDTNGQRCRDSSRRCRSLPVFVGTLSPSVWPWTIEPPLLRVDDGVPNRVDRLRGLGNAVVPQVAEWIGRRILEATDGMVHRT